MQETKSNSNNIEKLFEDPVNKQEVELVVKRVFGNAIKVVNYQIQPFSEEKLGFLGAHRHLIVTIRRDGYTENEVHTFFLKSMPYDVQEQADVIEESRAFFKETNFYKQILPKLLDCVKDKSWVAQCYLVKDDALVFENLKLRNFALRDKFLDIETLKSALTSVAKLHASSILAEKRLGKTFDQLYPKFIQESLFNRRGKFYEWFQSSIDVLITIAKHLGLDSTCVPDICNRMFDKFSTSKKWRNVLCHGDLKSYNLMFDDAKPRPNCVIVDFQLLRYVPATVDVLQLFYLSLRRELREKHETELLRFYHDVLCETLKENNETVQLPTFEEILQEYTEMRVVGIVTAGMYFPIMLLEGKKCEKMTKDSDGFGKLLFCDRTELVLDTMRDDPLYNEMLTEIITEMIQRSKQLLAA